MHNFTNALVKGAKASAKGARVVVTQATLTHMSEIGGEAGNRQAVIICRGAADLLPKTDGDVKVKVDGVTYTLHRSGKEFNFRVTTQTETTLPEYQKLFNKLETTPDKEFALELVK